MTEPAFTCSDLHHSPEGTVADAVGGLHSEVVAVATLQAVDGAGRACARTIQQCEVKCLSADVILLCAHAGVPGHNCSEGLTVVNHVYTCRGARS